MRPFLKSLTSPPPQAMPIGDGRFCQRWSAITSEAIRSTAVISTTSHDHISLWGPNRRLHSPPKKRAPKPKKGGRPAPLSTDKSKRPVARRPKTCKGAPAGTGASPSTLPIGHVPITPPQRAPPPNMAKAKLKKVAPKGLKRALSRFSG